MDDRALQALNRAWWDERVAVHATGEFHDVDPRSLARAAWGDA